MTILVTGAAGFIGAALCQRLLGQGEEVVAVDGYNAYYDPALKRARMARVAGAENLHEYSGDISDQGFLSGVFQRHRPVRVVNLAAQAGVRYSLENPATYVRTNLVGFGHLLELCRRHQVEHLVFASSSSVYGANTRLPFSETDNVDHPVSLYAASKKANELMAHSYAHLYGLPVTGLRFFTVYGPWGRPDMAYYGFTRAILAGLPIDLFNHGRHRRDFTYIDDVVEGLRRVLDCPPQGDVDWNDEAPNPASSYAPYRIFNIGNDQPVELMTMVSTLESLLGRRAETRLLPMQPGDVEATWADIDALRRAVDYRPSTSLEQGLERFVAWYRDYHGVRL